MSRDLSEPRRIAIIGGGAAGIAAAHVLQARHDVTLFEADQRLGGHAHTVEIERGVFADTAFLIYNDLHYPSFVRLLESLGVREHTVPADMSAAFIDHDKDFHYALLRGASGLFAQRKNLARPFFYRLFAEMALFRRRASRDMVRGTLTDTITLAEYLTPYSKVFRENFVLPLACAIWSLEGDHVLEYPARAILRFFHNHRFLEGDSGDAWRTFKSGSATYVGAFARAFQGEIRLGARVRRVVRDASLPRAGITLDLGGTHARFDEVIFATHADQALSLLERPTAEEHAALSPWRYQDNRVTLHTDEAWVHADPRLHASWNIVRRGGNARVTYFLNRVQPLATTRSYFLTLGEAPIRSASIIAEYSYRHPIFHVGSVATQARLEQGGLGPHTHFCGSYGGHGFHEDAVASAFRVAERLGATLGDVLSDPREASPRRAA